MRLDECAMWDWGKGTWEGRVVAFGTVHVCVCAQEIAGGEGWIFGGKIVCACARYQVNPKVSHLHAMKRSFRYLKGQPKLGLWYPKDFPFNLVAYTDSDSAGASLDMKSIIKGCQFLGCRLISWQCKKQTVVANSTTTAEYGFITLYTKESPIPPPNPITPPVILTLSLMPPKRTSTSEAPTQAAIRKLVADSIATALEAQAVKMANTNNPNRNSGLKRTPIARK
nr:putative ribonuclease H-like domain-containing protein [Tanacetum cinerariifolium]